MTFCSLYFFIACGILAVLNQLCPARWGRQLLLSGANFGFLVTVASRRLGLAAYVVIILATFAAIWLAAVRPRRGWVAACVVVALVLFVLVKRYSFLDLFLDPPVSDVYAASQRYLSVFDVLGLSYMLFKFIHVLVDVSQGQLRPGGLLCYANYQLSFFTIAAGPIQRYGDFCAFWQNPDARPADPRATWEAWSRVLTGMIKAGAGAGVIGAICSIPSQEPVATDDLWLQFAKHFYGYPIWLYFNFSGYTDVMIGAAQLLGLRLPENFNYPFLARNVIDYWNRWHITLSHWIRDYIFMTSYKAIAERFPRQAKVMGYLLLFLSLFLSGLWHGTTPGFAVFGALHGLGAMTNELWGAAIKSWLGREAYKRYLNSQLVRCLAIVATFHFICFSFLFFSLGYGGAVDLLRLLAWELASVPRLTTLTWLAAALLAVPSMATAMLYGYFWLAAQYNLPPFAEKFERWFRGALGTQNGVVLAKTVIVTLMFLLIWGLSEKDPVVVYQGF